MKLKLFVGFLVLIFLAEIYLRIFSFEQLKTRVFPLIYEPDIEFKYRYIKNKKSELSVPSIHNFIKIDSHGFYNPEFNKNKDSSKKRVIVIGDSNEAGIWLNSSHNFVRVMNDYFLENKKNIEVINLSRDGIWKTISNINLAKRAVIEYNSDFILFSSGNMPFFERDYVRECYKNYVIEYNPKVLKSRHECIEIVNRIEESSVMKFIYNSSFIIRALCKKLNENKYIDIHTGFMMYLNTWITKRYISEANTFYQYSYERSILELELLNKYLGTKNCKLVYIVYGENKELMDRLKKYNIHYVNVNFVGEDIGYEHDAHLNEKGHKEIADQIIKQLF